MNLFKIAGRMIECKSGCSEEAAFSEMQFICPGSVALPSEENLDDLVATLADEGRLDRVPTFRCH